MRTTIDEGGVDVENGSRSNEGGFDHEKLDEKLDEGRTRARSPSSSTGQSE